MPYAPAIPCPSPNPRLARAPPAACSPESVGSPRNPFNSPRFNEPPHRPAPVTARTPATRFAIADSRVVAGFAASEIAAAIAAIVETAATIAGGSIATQVAATKATRVTAVEAASAEPAAVESTSAKAAAVEAASAKAAAVEAATAKTAAVKTAAVKTAETSGIGVAVRCPQRQDQCNGNATR